MKRPEQSLQQAIAAYLDVALPAEAVWTAIGHGGGGKVRGAILKSMGLKPGIPDVLILHDDTVYFLELKSAKGRLSMVQIAMHTRLRLAGAPVQTCRSIEDVEAALRMWGIPLRAAVSHETRSAAA